MTLEALELLGQQIKLARKQRFWSESELAERAGIARATIQKIEKGDTRCAIGLVFEIAVLVGVPLFSESMLSLSEQFSRAQDKIALLSRQAHVQEVDDDF